MSKIISKVAVLFFWTFSASAQGASRVFLLILGGFGISLGVEEGVLVSIISAINIVFATSTVQIISKNLLTKKNETASLSMFACFLQVLVGIVSSILLFKFDCRLTVLIASLLGVYGCHTVLRQKYIVKRRIRELLFLDLSLLLTIFTSVFLYSEVVYFFLLPLVFCSLCFIFYDENLHSLKREELRDFFFLGLSNLSTTALPFLLPIVVASFHLDSRVLKILTFMAIITSLMVVVPRAIFNKSLGGIELENRISVNKEKEQYTKSVVGFYSFSFVFGFGLSLAYILYESSLEYLTPVIVFLVCCLFFQSLIGSLSYFDINILAMLGKEKFVMQTNVIFFSVIALVIFILFLFNDNLQSIGALVCYGTVAVCYFFRYLYFRAAVKG